MRNHSLLLTYEFLNASVHRVGTEMPIPGLQIRPDKRAAGDPKDNYPDDRDDQRATPHGETDHACKKDDHSLEQAFLQIGSRNDH